MYLRARCKDVRLTAYRTRFLMAELTCQFVRPDKLLYEGTVESLILPADGEYGVWPGHALEIIALMMVL